MVLTLLVKVLVVAEPKLVAGVLLVTVGGVTGLWSCLHPSR